MSENLTLEDFKQKFGKLSKSEFTKRFPTPFLLICQFENPDSKGSDPISEMERHFKQFTLQDSSKDSAQMLSIHVFPTGLDISLPSKTIRIGRRKDNDIVFDYAGVSNRHSYLVISKVQEGIIVTDANSKNGTRVNKKKLGPKERLLLKDGDRISLSKGAGLVFKHSESFFEWLCTI